MESLSYYASLAEIFGALTIIVGAIFALVEYRDFRKQKSVEMATELCRRFSDPDMARAITLVKLLPDGVSYRQIRDLDPEYESAAQIVGMAFETMGLLAQRKVASFELIEQLTGGLILLYWRKAEKWILESRKHEENPWFGEWVEWLATQLEERRGEMVPAYERFADGGSRL